MKILYVTTVASTMTFFPEHIKMLLAAGHTVEFAGNCVEKKPPEYCAELGLPLHHIPFSRSPLSRANLTAYKQIKKLIREGNYDIVHTHTPNASAITRLACRGLRKRTGLRVFYTAHGFHFYRGAPLKNWLLYYPVEKLCARWTDTLITINREDYDKARRSLRARRIELIPGVGVDLTRFQGATVDRDAVRASLGIPQDAEVLIYIGELNMNKNQASLLNMMAELLKNRPRAVLLLVGAGSMMPQLREKADALQISDRVFLIGYRTDIPQLLYASDVCTPSSIREGFGLNVIEAMACGVPVVAYDNRGHRTIIRDGETGYLVPNGDFCQMAERVSYLLACPEKATEMAAAATAVLPQFSTSAVLAKMREVYEPS